MPTDTATPAPAPEPRRDLEISISIHIRVPPPAEPAVAPARATARADDVLSAIKAAMRGDPTPGCDCPACQAKRSARGGATRPMPPI